MPIQPEEREENVVASIYSYIQSNFTLLSVDYEGVGIGEENQNEWVRVDTMFPSPRFARQVGNGVAANDLMGAEVSVMLNMNIFKKRGVEQDDNAYSMHRTKDTLANLFRVPLGIPVMNHVGGAPLVRIGTLQTSDLSGADLGLDVGTGISTYNLTSTMRYVMMWDKPS